MKEAAVTSQVKKKEGKLSLDGRPPSGWQRSSGVLMTARCVGWWFHPGAYLTPSIILVLVLVLAEARRQIPSHPSNSGRLQSFHEDLIHEPQLLLLIRQEKMMENLIFWRGSRREFFIITTVLGFFSSKQNCD